MIFIRRVIRMQRIRRRDQLGKLGFGFVDGQWHGPIA
jgi:hypothetical protein